MPATRKDMEAMIRDRLLDKPLSDAVLHDLSGAILEWLSSDEVESFLAEKDLLSTDWGYALGALFEA